MKVLVVDNEPDLVAVLSYWLSSHGYEVLTCDRAAEAVDIIGREKCDAVLLDVMLPEVSGLMVISDIARTAPRTRIVVMSALHREFWEPQAFISGADHCISKPIDLTYLEKILRQTRAKSRTA